MSFRHRVGGGSVPLGRDWGGKERLNSNYNSNNNRGSDDGNNGDSDLPQQMSFYRKPKAHTGIVRSVSVSSFGSVRQRERRQQQDDESRVPASALFQGVGGSSDGESHGSDAPVLLSPRLARQEEMRLAMKRINKRHAAAEERRRLEATLVRETSRGGSQRNNNNSSSNSKNNSISNGNKHKNKKSAGKFDVTGKRGKKEQRKSKRNQKKKGIGGGIGGGSHTGAADGLFAKELEGRQAEVQFASALDIVRSRWKEEAMEVREEILKEEDMEQLMGEMGGGGVGKGFNGGKSGAGGGGGGGSNFQTAGVSSIVAEQYLTTFDLKAGTKNLRIAAWALIGCLLMMAQIWTAWNETTRALEETTVGFMLRVMITFTSIVLVLEMWDYYRYQRGVELNSWFIMDNQTWRRHMNKFMALELVVLGLHTYPEFGLDLYDDNVGVLMLARLYLLVRVLRDLSPVYKARLALASDPFLRKTGVVEFNWLLTLKFLFNANMWTFVIGSMIVSWLVMSYIVWCLERQARPVADGHFSPETSLYMTVITMTTVGFGDITPVVGRARVAAGFAAIAGSLVLALLSFAVIESLTETPQERRVRHKLELRATTLKQKHLAARYIQLHWKHYLDRRETPFNTYAWHRMIKTHTWANVYMKNQLRRYRRVIFAAKDLDDLVISRLEDVLDQRSLQWSHEIARKMGARGILKRIPHMSTIDQGLQRVAGGMRRAGRGLDKVIEAMRVQQREREREEEERNGARRNNSGDNDHHTRRRRHDHSHYHDDDDDDHHEQQHSRRDWSSSGARSDERTGDDGWR